MKVWTLYICFSVVCGIKMPPGKPRIELKMHKKVSSPELLPCTAELCQPHSSAPTLFTDERTDGVGGRFLSALGVMSIAHSMGLNFGGLFRKSEHGERKVHGLDGLDFMKMGNFMMGKTLFGEVMINNVKIDATFRKVSELVEAQKNGTLETCKNAFIEPRSVLNVPKNNKLSSLIFSQEFMTQLWREPTIQNSLVMKHELSFATRRPTVAVHVRRGDVSRLGGSVPFIPDSWFLDIIATIQTQLPNADVHVFSDTDKYGTKIGIQHEKTNWTMEDFRIYEDKGMTVHLDESEQAAWAHIARADVALISDSSFSWAPALFNRGCVIAPYSGKPAPPTWIFKSLKPLNNGVFGEEEIKKCVEAVKARVPKDDFLKAEQASLAKGLQEQQAILNVKEETEDPPEWKRADMSNLVENNGIRSAQHLYPRHM